jgi:hypothetical protein
MMALGQKGEEKMGYWLKLEVIDFSYLQGNNFGLNLLALANRDYKPLQGGEIQFFVGGDPINQTVRTDKNGRALKKEAVIEIEPGAKKILIEAQIIGTDKRTKEFALVPWPEKEKSLTKEEKELKKTKSKLELIKVKKELETTSKGPDNELEKLERDLSMARLKTQLQETTKKELQKNPADIIPHVCGTDGDYAITWEVITEDKSPVPGVIVQISDAQNEKRFRNLPKTDKKGCTSQKIKFTTKERVLTASVLGSGISTWINLFNQRKEKTNGCKI